MDKIIGLLLFAYVAGVHAATPTCLRLDWNYDPAVLLGSFFVYVSPTSGVYPMVPGNALESRPRVIIDAYPAMVLSVSCAALKLNAPGPWYLVVTAVSVDMTQESPPSNELMIDGPDGPPPYVPPPPKPPPPVTLPPPLPWPTRPASPVPPGPSAGGAASPIRMSGVAWGRPVRLPSEAMCQDAHQYRWVTIASPTRPPGKAIRKSRGETP